MQCVDLGGRRSTQRVNAAISGFFQAEDGIRDVERSRGLGDVYKRQVFLLHNIQQRDDQLSLGVFYKRSN